MQKKKRSYTVRKCITPYRKCLEDNHSSSEFNEKYFASSSSANYAACKAYASKMATGIGYDVHKLEKGYKLILGGIEIPHSKGLVGHSDADVLTHAIIDSLLGAAALGDIGDHFPDTEEKYKGIDSQVLLQKTMAIIAAAFVSEKENYAAQFNIINIDATIIAQAPKLASYKEAIKNNLAKTLKISPNKINIKATTEEHLGFTGSENGIKAVAVSVIGSN